MDNLGSQFRFTKSVMNFCECTHSSFYVEVLAEEPPYKCDLDILTPVEIRTNEELIYDAEMGECTLFFDLTIENTDFTETSPIIVTTDGPTRESTPVSLDDCCLQVLQFVEEDTID